MNQEPSVIKKRYQLSNIQQLVDLNGDTINFRLRFKVTGPPDKEYDAVVLNQTQLDSGENIPYKKVKGGVIGGEMVSDKDLYQNYFLSLKAENPLEVEVEIEFEKLPYPLLPPESKKVDTPKKSYKMYLIIGGVIVALGAIYYFYFYRKKGVKSKEISKSRSPERSKSPLREKSYLNFPVSKSPQRKTTLFQLSQRPRETEISRGFSESLRPNMKTALPKSATNARRVQISESERGFGDKESMRLGSSSLKPKREDI